MFVNYILVLLYCFVGDVLFKYFSHVYWFYQSVLPFCFLFYYYFLFSHFIVLMFFKDQMFYILKKPNLLFFFFYVLCFFVLCRKLLHMSEFKDFSYVFTRNSIALNQYSFFFSWRYWVDTAPFVEKVFSSPFNCFGSSEEKSIDYICIDLFLDF